MDGNDDDYSLQQELEALAGNAFNPGLGQGDDKPEPMKETLARWQKLFGLSPDDAVDRIMDHRTNLTRTRISDAHWEIVRAEKETEGYDREAYEYELELQKKKAALPDLVPTARENANSTITYLVELTGPLVDPEKIQQIARLEELPAVVKGNSVEDGRPVSLCCIDGAAKAAILTWAVTESAAYEPTVLVDPRSLR